MPGPRNAAGQLRTMLDGDEIIVAPGCFSALGGRIIEKNGFRAVYISGYGVAAHHLGRPDVGLTTMNEAVDIGGKVASAVSVPVICDADTGYGNAINVMLTVEEFIKSGVAAIHLEDQVAPKRCGHVAGKQVVSREEAAGKIRAAARVRDEMAPDFVLIARCDARGVAGGSLEDAIDRLRAYRDAGADVAFGEGLTSEDEIARVCEAVPGPVLYNRTGISPSVPATRLQELGVDIVINPSGATRAAARALWDFYAALKVDDEAVEARLEAQSEGHPIATFHEFIGFPEIRALEEAFLPEEESEKYRDALGFQP